MQENNMSLYVDLMQQGYLDKEYGVVSNTKGSCDNYNLFTAEAAEISSWGRWPQYQNFFKSSEVQPGLIKRYPGRVNGGISQDEIIGAATLSTEAAERIYKSRRWRFWYFNPDKKPFSFSMWLGRFIDVKPYVKMRATGHINLFDQFCWSVMTFLSPLSSYGNTSGKLLKYVQISRMEGNNWLCDQAIRFYRWRMSKMYPGGLKELVGIYFSKEHPFYAYAKNNFL
jgi:hypothetical protein